MPKEELLFENFLKEVNLDYIEFVMQTNDFLLQNGYSIKMELAKSGYVVSYNNVKTKRVTINYVFRKDALFIRIYGDNVSKYNSFIDTLPESMKKKIAKAPVCKRLVDPEKCNSRCPMGYSFTIDGESYQKCRYNSFLLEINAESIPFIKEFIENEVRERAV